jgi:hypothetical protein
MTIPQRRLCDPQFMEAREQRLRKLMKGGKWAARNADNARKLWEDPSREVPNVVTLVQGVIYAQTACPHCAGVARLSRDDVTTRIKEIHGDSVVLVGEYEGTTAKAQFKCDAGHQWEARTDDVIYHQTGCPQCIWRSYLSRDDVIAWIKEVHGDSVALVGEHKSGRLKTKFECDAGHQWEANIGSVIHAETGCPRCATTGFNPSLPGILYYLKVTAPCGVYYKIGITNRSIQCRFDSVIDRERIEVVKQWSYENGEDALRRERAILKAHHAARYKGKPILVTGGNTELFPRDVLGLDKKGANDPQPDPGSRKAA